MPKYYYPSESTKAYKGSIVSTDGRRREVRLTKGKSSFTDEFGNRWRGLDGSMAGETTVVMNGSPGDRLSIPSLRALEGETVVLARYLTHTCTLVKHRRIRKPMRIRETKNHWVDEGGRKYNKNDGWPYDAAGPKEWRIELDTIEFVPEEERHNTIFY